jgi:aldehyde dehydrogenase (NAD(P)+)
VTPWVVPLVTLTDKELVEQATAFAKSVYQNCSFACNSPKVLVVSSEWKQRDEFVDKMAEFLKTNPTPPAYYPGVIQRWEAFREAYPKAREIGCQLDTEKRQLSKPMLQDRPVVLPWLISEIEVDLSTPEGRKNAEAEYALKNETFGPVFAIATVRSSNKPKEFMDTAVDLCNNYMFGSLSITMTVPQHLQGDAMIEEAFTQLRYGTIVTNSWSAFSYNMRGLPWGAYPGEKLEDVESGIGSVHQYCFVQHVVKGVALFHKGAPDLVWPPHTRENAAVNRALVNVTLKPGVYTVFMLVWALIVAQVWPMLKKVFGYS